MSQDEFTTLFTFVSGKFDSIESTLSSVATKDDISQILNRLDSIEKQLEIDDDERLVMGHQLERLDKWIHGIADKIGYNLKT